MVYGFLQLHLFWISNCIYAACLSMKAKRSNQSKAPSTNKHCFLFPLSPSLSVLYLLVFEFSIVIVNHVKELGPFIDLWGSALFTPKNFGRPTGHVLTLLGDACLVVKFSAWYLLIIKEFKCFPMYLKHLIGRLSNRVVVTHVKCIVTTQAEAQVSGILEKQQSRLKDRSFYHGKKLFYISFLQ